MSTDLKPWQAAAIYNPYEHLYMAGGVATGKTFTGSHFGLDCIEQHPGYSGLIGANTYDQLSQATLREFLYWLDEYRYDYVIDMKPPASWGARREFKTYKNVMSIRPKSKPKQINTVFTRVMSEANPLRGIEFSWYWLDETRDTPENTHDVVISRLRENKSFRRGLITSTTNGEDWAYQRFVKNLRRGQRLYGSMHVPTIESVNHGVISNEYYQTMLATYSTLMAEQELWAKHVNVRGGRAYYACGEENRMHKAPWGDKHPNPSQPLVVGCDFNYAPAPCVWMVGQIGPGQWSDQIHWFGEISDSQVSTPEMTMKLLNYYPGFMYRVFGDSSGKRGTTSNAGQHDYNQMAQVFEDHGAPFTVDVEQSNPHVKDRVENMNRMFKNALGEVKQTYNPTSCPLFDSDTKTVGWKQTIQMGRGKLDDGGNKQLTHAADGAGYALWKLFPPGRRAMFIPSLPSMYAQEISSVVGTND